MAKTATVADINAQVDKLDQEMEVLRNRKRELNEVRKRIVILESAAAKLSALKDEELEALNIKDIVSQHVKVDNVATASPSSTSVKVR